MSQYYTGIGSRETPRDVLQIMQSLAARLGSEGQILRSGGAEGADTAFQVGAQGYPKEIYLPWPGFNHNYGPDVISHLDDEAALLTRKFHPRLSELSEQEMLQAIRSFGGGLPALAKLMTRNAYQVLGRDLKTPSRFVAAYTPGGHGGGGTGQALRIARHYGIPIRDLGTKPTLLRLMEYLKD